MKSIRKQLFEKHMDSGNWEDHAHRKSLIQRRMAWFVTPPWMTDFEVRVMIERVGEAGIMVMRAPTDRLCQGITMNHSSSQSEMIALSYGG